MCRSSEATAISRTRLCWSASGAVALGLAGLSQVLRPGWILEFIGGATELSGSITNRATIWNLAGSSTLAVVVIALLLAVVVVLIRPRGADDAEILGVAAPLLWALAAVATLRGTESLSVLVPMLTAVLLALAIRWGTRRVSGAPTAGA